MAIVGSVYQRMSGEPGGYYSANNVPHAQSHIESPGTEVVTLLHAEADG